MAGNHRAMRCDYFRSADKLINLRLSAIRRTRSDLVRLSILHRTDIESKQISRDSERHEFSSPILRISRTECSRRADVFPTTKFVGILRNISRINMYRFVSRDISLLLIEMFVGSRGFKRNATRIYDIRSDRVRGSRMVQPVGCAPFFRRINNESFHARRICRKKVTSTLAQDP